MDTVTVGRLQLLNAHVSVTAWQVMVCLPGPTSSEALNAYLDDLKTALRYRLATFLMSAADYFPEETPITIQVYADPHHGYRSDEENAALVLEWADYFADFHGPKVLTITRLGAVQIFEEPVPG